MNRAGLLAALLIWPGFSAGAEQLVVPGLTPLPEEKQQGPQDTLVELEPCSDVQGDPRFCTRTLACLGNDGLWIDGMSQGWGQSGLLRGVRSDGVVCAGAWAYGGVLGSATAEFLCTDGLTGAVIYFSQDPVTGTGIGRGTDSLGRPIQAWTGDNVLQFLGKGDMTVAALPCGENPIPVS